MYVNDCLLHLNRSAIPFGEYKIGLGRGSDNHYLKNKSVVLSKSLFEQTACFLLLTETLNKRLFHEKLKPYRWTMLTIFITRYNVKSNSI